ncbi:MAG: universal stress protein [Planctomycetaceae bacterium]
MPWTPKQTVVVPIDFSDASVNAIQVGMDCAERPDGVRVVHVLPPLSLLTQGSLDAVLSDESHMETARQSLDNFILEHGFRGVTSVIMVGNPGGAIVDYANKCGADMIVIPSHGYSGFKRALVGSTAERVLRHAECPVLVLRRAED